MSELRIDMQRLQHDIQVLAEIGRKENQGIYRTAFTAADMEAKAWLKARISEASLDYYLDGAANVHGRCNWHLGGASVITGSHLDSVPGGGHLDGSLGVVAGLECLRRIHELKLPTKRPLELIAFSDEEGRFGGIFGSSALCGLLTPENIHSAKDLSNISLCDAMQAVGLNAMDALSSARSANSIHSYVELHIEQGPVLDHHSTPIGVVDAITGLFKWNISLTGIASHAGATPMHMRYDAFQGLAEFSGEINRVLEEHGGPRSVATIGRVELKPGAANVVPGQVEFSLDVRDTNQKTLDDLADAFRRSLSSISRRRGLMFEFQVLSEIAPVKCDTGLMQYIGDATSSLNLKSLQLASGAAHDAQIMGRVTRTAMIFVPSKAGRSHSPAEWTSWEDIEHGANVLLNTLYKLASN